MLKIFFIEVCSLIRLYFIKSFLKRMVMNVNYFFIIALMLCGLIFSSDKDFMAKQKKEFEIPATEDLMREHGLLNRVLLIYEEIIKTIDSHESFPLESFKKALDIIKEFIEDYHERLEEDYLFPYFEKKKVETKLIATLKKQHIKGREITAELKEMATKNLHQEKNKKRVKQLLKNFIKMYRPHEAREDTILFPKVRDLMNEDEFQQLSEKFEEMEHQLFGKDGFEKMLKRIETIEKDLGIYKLEQFTPTES